jgi:hypothetical protein
MRGCLGFIVLLLCGCVDVDPWEPVAHSGDLDWPGGLPEVDLEIVAARLVGTTTSTATDSTTCS